MASMKRLLCLIGWHDWHIIDEIEVPGSGFTDDPGDYAPGGVNYVIQCPRCGAADVIRKRGAWIAPDYPKRS